MKALNIKQVMEKVGLGKSTLYRMISAGEFPKPFILVGNRTAWVDEDVDAWIAERARHRQEAASTRGRPALRDALEQRG